MNNGQKRSRIWLRFLVACLLRELEALPRRDKDAILRTLEGFLRSKALPS